MPEGHTIYRAALDQRPMLIKRRLAVSSPQGRFADGAAQLDGCVCEAIEAYGKHLLYRFRGGLFLHIHLGLFGRFRHTAQPASEPRGAVRVRLESKTHVVDINGPTVCEVLDRSGVETLTGRIGPDVLRDDAEPARAFARIGKSRAPIGQLLMDQGVIGGIGNIYRTEILWRCGLHPLTPGRAIGTVRLQEVWDDARRLLAFGVRHNAIITTKNALSKPSKTRYRERVNIFGKAHCPRCKNSVREFTLAARTAYVCETCQPAHESDE